MQEVAVQLALQVFGGVIIAVVTVKLSVRQFSSTRWWELKAQAYSTLVAALAQELGRSWQQMEAMERGSVVDMGVRDPARRVKAANMDRIHEAAAAGAYLLSKQAAGRLETLRKELADVDERDAYTQLSGEYTALRKCLDDIRTCAHADLGTSQ